MSLHLCCGIAPTIEVSRRFLDDKSVYEVRCYRCGRATGERPTEDDARAVWARMPETPQKLGSRD